MISKYQVYINNIINIFIGIICSLIAWWIIFHLLGPKLKIRDKITIRTTDGSHRLKIENVGFRGLVNWTCSARFEFKSTTSNLWKYVNIPTNINWEPHLSAGNNRIIVFRPELIKEKTSNPFEQKIADHFGDKKISFHDLFNYKEQSRLRFSLHGYDAFSGAARVFEHVYKVSDITDIGQLNLKPCDFKPHAQFGFKRAYLYYVKKIMELKNNQYVVSIKIWLMSKLRSNKINK